ncbi:TonB-dependent receptor family protein [Mucilaginibacter sp. BJC16-A38]|uniref:outer membrane beta-barrel family protein n=1 Tax=Mucilaginibacter phenanthrenivorans TaxID=1234842 RepID=UPI00215832DA|nr:outer membrane beta-barrel family protein [Mucilaginibacter phenanthrenivorans]MCR8557831.1 TonB-dependent receptor family protein [Mucilaginibacter phenanthrenivorans]
MRSTTIKTLAFLILYIIGITLAFAKPPVKVSGSLIDDKGKPMDYATVSLLNVKDSTVIKGTLSNDNGVYVFDHITPGTYIVKATNVGYEKTLSKPFTVSDASSDITLPAIKMQQASHTLGTVTVTASKPLVEHKIDRTVMNVENSVLAAGNTALEILERAPGVSIDKDDNISLKGKQGVTVMINDKLTYLTSTQLATLLRSTDGTTIQSIEIISNPSAKYDASGNSGIINIKLKKNKQTGTNGSVTVGAGYGNTFKNNESISLNHKEGNLNVFGSFSHDDRKREHTLDIRRIVTDSTGGKTYFNQFSSIPNDNHNNSYRLGADYDISSKNTIGFLVNGYFNTETDDNVNKTYIGTQPSVTDSYQTTLSHINQSYKNFALNLNDRYKIDTAGQEIAVDLDYSKFKNNSNSQYNTYFFQPDGSEMASPLFLRNQTPSNITIRTAKVDYTYPINKILKLETGFKLSDVKTDNDLRAQKQVNGNYINDTTLTNRFVYTEKVDAIYANLSQNYKNFSIQTGLRAEYTSSTGDLITNNNVVKRHYLDFFPSVFINRTLNDKNEIGLSYSRRIDRPGYDALNPFVYYLDQYTYEKGNPFLNPQYTNNFEFNYTYNKSITLTLGYSHTSDAITQILLTDPISKATYQTNLNLQSQNNYNVNLYAPYTIAKWWEGNVNVTGFYMKFKTDTLLGGKLDNGKAAYQIKTTQTFMIAKGWKAELSNYYNSAMTYGIFNIKPQYATDAGISHSFLEKKANIKLSMSDIFNTRRNDVTSYYQSNNLDIRQKNESRITRLTFTYNFGNNKIKMREHQTGADDEKGRVKGN